MKHPDQVYRRNALPFTSVLSADTEIGCVGQYGPRGLRQHPTDDSDKKEGTGPLSKATYSPWTFVSERQSSVSFTHGI